MHVWTPNIFSTLRVGNPAFSSNTPSPTVLLFCVLKALYFLSNMYQKKKNCPLWKYFYSLPGLWALQHECRWYRNQLHLKICPSSISNIDALIAHFNRQDKTGYISLCLHTSVTDVLYKQMVSYRLIKSIHLYQLAVPDNVFQRISSVPTLPFDIVDINK